MLLFFEYYFAFIVLKYLLVIFNAWYGINIIFNLYKQYFYCIYFKNIV